MNGQCGGIMKTSFLLATHFKDAGKTSFLLATHFITNHNLETLTPIIMYFKRGSQLGDHIVSPITRPTPRTPEVSQNLIYKFYYKNMLTTRVSKIFFGIKLFN